MNVAGLFSGIGGLEIPFHRREDSETHLLCDVWEPSAAVLQAQFPGVPLWRDISDLPAVPDTTQVITAGFPCTDLSQAGRTAGIGGRESGLVSHVFRLLENREIEWLVLENVRNMLVLDKGRAMQFLVERLEELGFSWAYRLVDSRFSGVPQRRHRVLFVASRTHDPRNVLFADNAEEVSEGELRDDAFGFYWTEGLRGLGWAKDGVPPLKGGSSVGIPSTPGIWLPNAPVGRRLVTPSIEDAELLQGFTKGWTEPAQTGSRNGPRWKLVGNAVTVGVAEWLVDRIYEPGEVVVPATRLSEIGRWPNAAYGRKGERWEFQASFWPRREPYRHLMDLLDQRQLRPLSHRATAGFLSRTRQSTLNFNREFLADVEGHAEHMQKLAAQAA